MAGSELDGEPRENEGRRLWREFITTAGAQDGLALSAITRHLSSSEDRTEYSLALWGIFVR